MEQILIQYYPGGVTDFNIKMWKTLKAELLTLRVTEIKGKVFPVHATKAYTGSRSTAPCILNLEARWRQVVNIMPGHITPLPEKDLSTHCIRGSVDLRSILDVFEKRKSFGLSGFEPQNVQPIGSMKINLK
jgi:hypothetical protein